MENDRTWYIQILVYGLWFTMYCFTVQDEALFQFNGLVKVNT